MVDQGFSNAMSAGLFGDKEPGYVVPLRDPDEAVGHTWRTGYVHLGLRNQAAHQIKILFPVGGGNKRMGLAVGVQP